MTNKPTKAMMKRIKTPTTIINTIKNTKKSLCFKVIFVMIKGHGSMEIIDLDYDVAEKIKKKYDMYKTDTNSLIKNF